MLPVPTSPALQGRCGSDSLQLQVVSTPRHAMLGGRQGPCVLGIFQGGHQPQAWVCPTKAGAGTRQYLPACWVTSAKDRFCSLCRMRKVRAGPTTLPNRSYINASPITDPRLTERPALALSPQEDEAEADQRCLTGMFEGNAG